MKTEVVVVLVLAAAVAAIYAVAAIPAAATYALRMVGRRGSLADRTERESTEGPPLHAP